MFAIYVCLLAEAEDLEYIVGDVIVVCIFTFMLLHVFHYTDGQRQYHNLVGSLQYHLPEHEPRQF